MTVRESALLNRIFSRAMARRGEAAAAVAVTAFLAGACQARAQYTPAQQQPIELADLISFFLVPESAPQPTGDWYAWSGPASPIAWNPNEVRWDEQRQTFVRDGSAIVGLDGRALNAVGSSEPARWPIRMFGPREGFTRVAIASRVTLSDLALDLPALLSGQRVAYEAQRCDAAADAGGNRLFHISWPGYRPAWLHHQWVCDGNGCQAYLSISQVDPDARTLAAMPNTECGAAGGPRTADAAPGAGGSEAGPSLLFAAGAGDLTASEQQEIFAALGLAVAADGAGFVDTVCGRPAGAQVELPDLNDDGTPEVLVVFGNTCTSGMAGSSVQLFIKTDGAYRTQLGFPGATAEPLEARSGGYPDLRIGGPGFCFPVWRWDGSAYVHDRDEPQQPGGCSRM